MEKWQSLVYCGGLENRRRENRPWVQILPSPPNKNCDMEIIDNTEKSEQQELVEDLVQIITVFSCKLQGKRANKARKLVKELIEEGGEDNDKNNQSNVAPKQ